MRGGVRHAAGPLLRRQVRTPVLTPTRDTARHPRVAQLTVALVKMKVAACAAKSATTRVLVCSKNPVKVGAVQKAFGLAFPERAFEFRSEFRRSLLTCGIKPFPGRGGTSAINSAVEQHSGDRLIWPPGADTSAASGVPDQPFGDEETLAG